MANTTDARYVTNMAATILDDIQTVNWSTTELFEFLNLAQVEMVNLAPRTNVQVAAIQLAAGIRQTLPYGGIFLFDVPYNRGPAGTTIEGAINRVDKELMNKKIPGWATATASDIVKRFMYDPNTPKNFYIYPAQTATPHYVEIEYAAMPAWIPNLTPGTKITVSDEFRNILINLVIAKALEKYADVGDNGAKAKEYRLLAELELGISRPAGLAQPVNTQNTNGKA